MQRQLGYLSLIAASLMMLAGVTSLSVVHNFSSQLQAQVTHQFASQALFLAESGLERTLARLQTGQLTCADINGHVDLTQVSLGSDIGQFTVSTPGGDLSLQEAATLSSNITLSSTSFNVNSTTNYADAGWLIIDRELMSYTGKSATQFTGVARGPTAIAHLAGTRVIQIQCDVLAEGAVTDFTTPKALRRTQVSVSGAGQRAWVVGKKNNNFSNAAEVAQFNHPQSGWNYSTTSASNEELRGVAFLNYTEGWAVGKDMDGPKRLNILRWQASSNTWITSPGIPIPSNDYIKDLNAVSVVSSQEAWAVGQRPGGSNRTYTILKWNGTDWCLLGQGNGHCAGSSIPGAPGRDLYAVHVADTDGDGVDDLGFAIGQNAFILQYDGSNWSKIFEGGNNLRSVFIVSASEAWIIGDAGDFYRWNGSTWTKIFPAIGGGAQLRGLYMLDTDQDGDADEGWAVGKYDRAIRYTSASGWVDTPTSGVGHLNSVAMFATDDVWVAADGGRLVHWNGSQWTKHDPPSNMNKHLKSIAIFEIPSIAGVWREIFT